MRHFTIPFAIALTLLIHPLPAMAETVFTFQGRLGSAGAPAQGDHDLIFRLFDAQSSGTQIGSDLAVDAVDVAGGIFTVQLDFGEAPFNSSPRWLEIDVRESSGGAYTTLETRYRVGAAPFAIEALFVAPGAVDTAAIQDGAVTSAKIAAQAVTRSRIKPDAIGTEQIENSSVTSADIQDGAVDTTDLAEGAVGSSQIANQSIAAIDLASGSVGTDEIIDGTITPADVSGGLYARKGHVYLRESNVLVGFGKTDASASCDDANDLLMIAVCNPDSPNNDLRLLQRRLTNIDNDVLPVGLRCQMENDNPTVPQRFSATVGCVAVP